MEPNEDVFDRARKVNLVLMDVDGVLTDGRILMYSDGTEGRAFSARDGHGVRMGQRGGLLFGIVSGRDCKVVSDRAEELYITEVHQGIFEKLERYSEILERFQLPDEAVCYIGDDIVDVPVLRQVGSAPSPHLVQSSDVVLGRLDMLAHRVGLPADGFQEDHRIPGKVDSGNHAEGTQRLLVDDGKALPVGRRD